MYLFADNGRLGKGRVLFRFQDGSFKKSLALLIFFRIDFNHSKGAVVFALVYNGHAARLFYVCAATQIAVRRLINLPDGGLVLFALAAVFLSSEHFLIALLFGDKVFYSNNGADNSDYGKQNDAAYEYPEHVIGIRRQKVYISENKVHGKGDAAGEKYL